MQNNLSLEQRLADIDKNTRKRRILMKQKCNYIDHQISMNVSKLDELLNILKAQRQSMQLKTINQVQQNTTMSDQLIQPLTDQSSVKIQRRLKFKYSINRLYDFEQQNQLQLKTVKKLNLSQISSNSIKKQSEEQQQQLLDDIGTQDNFLTDLTPRRKQDNLPEEQLLLSSDRSPRLMRNSTVRSSQFTQVEEVQEIVIETRYNWIQKYLDHDFSDTIVKGVDAEGNQVKLVRFNKKGKYFQCKIVGEMENDVIGDMSNSLSYSNELGTPRKATSQNQSSYLNIDYNQFTHLNSQINVCFPLHTQSINLLTPETKQVAKLTISKTTDSIRILLKNQNTTPTQMQRIMIFKELVHTETQEKYKIVWSRYEKESFVEDVILEGGESYLVANMCTGNGSELSFMFNPVDLKDLKVQKTADDPWRTYNILCSSFEECSKVFMSQNVYDDEKPLQFLRANFLDFGLVLQIYQNIYTEKVAFFDKSQEKSSKNQDIALLFPQIYTKLQLKNVYLPGQLVIKFFQVTQKPARLYFPQKRVLIGSQMAQHVTVHSTFK